MGRFVYIWMRFRGRIAEVGGKNGPEGRRRGGVGEMGGGMVFWGDELVADKVNSDILQIKQNIKQLQMVEIITGVGIISIASILNFAATKIYNHFSGDNKNFVWSTTNFELPKKQGLNDFEEIKKRTRIVVIDDEKNFPVSLFRNEGYAIDEWEKVEDYGKLESGFYDIIVLDIKGVALHISEDDGLGVLENLKTRNPAQIVISYSQHSYDLNKIKFFQLADENIAKPSDYLKIKSIIDNIISNQFNAERYINSMRIILQKNQVSNGKINRIKRNLLNSIDKKERPDWKKTFSPVNDKADLLPQLISLGNTILKFYI